MAQLLESALVTMVKEYTPYTSFEMQRLKVPSQMPLLLVFHKRGHEVRSMLFGLCLPLLF